ncbi:MAG: hypothetical protein K9M08_23980 [Pirellula sp.]|nr:hypothetical protein [Pirellula sp.]
MKKFVCTFISAIMVCTSSALIADCPPTPLPYNILDPPKTNPAQQYTGPIGGSGDATGWTSFVFKIRLMYSDVVRSSEGGTAAQCSWGATCDEPSDGWDPDNPTLFIAAHAEIWSGGVEKDYAAIKVK